MRCYSCGKEIRENARVCPFCHAVQGIESDLIAQAKAGDQEAFTELYNRTVMPMISMAKSILRDADAAEDVVQDAFSSAFKSLDTLQDGTKFQPWMRKIVYRNALDYIKKRREITFTEMSKSENEEFDPTLLNENVDWMPEVVIDQDETARLIHEIVDGISEDQRTSICMYYFEHYSVRDIAEMLEVSENTVKSRLKYGRDKVGAQVETLKKKGTNLYGLAPIPFLVFLLHSQEAQAASVATDASVVSAFRNVLSEKMQKEKAIADTAASITEEGGNTGGVFSNAGGPATDASGSVAGKATKGFGVKLLTGVVAVGLLGGGVFYATNRLKNETSVEVGTTSSIETITEEITEEAETTYELAERVTSSEEVQGTESNFDTLEEVDVFEYVEVIYEGVSQNGTAYITTSGGDYVSECFQLDKTTQLSNGDTVTVTFRSEEADYMESQGLKPAELEKTYTVSLPEYASSLDQIPGNFAEAYEDKVEELFNNEKSNWETNHVAFQNRTYLADYLLTKADPDSDARENVLYLVYEIQVTQDGSPLTYYWYAGFYDVYVYEDGTCGFDEYAFAVPQVRVVVNVEGEGFGFLSYDDNGPVKLYYSGYEELSELYETVIAGNTEYVNQESMVDSATDNSVE